jgi:hypothetical protein
LLAKPFMFGKLRRRHLDLPNEEGFVKNTPTNSFKPEGKSTVLEYITHAVNSTQQCSISLGRSTQTMIWWL